jgi:hypothetical protein
MQDPHLVAVNSSYNYDYGYDTMRRKTSAYPAAADNMTHGNQYFHYDTARLDTYTNRAKKQQTFTSGRYTYDRYDRPTWIHRA